MATPGQIIFTKATSLVLSIVIITWLRVEGFGWIVSILVGIGGYVLFKMAIALAIGLREGFALRAEDKRRGRRPEDIMDKIAEATKGLPPAEQEAVAKPHH